jgi:hypothetical protein
MIDLILAVLVVVFAVVVAWHASSRWFDAYMRDIDARDKQVEREVDRLLDKANAECATRQRLKEPK